MLAPIGACSDSQPEPSPARPEASCTSRTTSSTTPSSVQEAIEYSRPGSSGSAASHRQASCTASAASASGSSRSLASASSVRGWPSTSSGCSGSNPCAFNTALACRALWRGAMCRMSPACHCTSAGVARRIRQIAPPMLPGLRRSRPSSRHSCICVAAGSTLSSVVMPVSAPNCCCHWRRVGTEAASTSMRSNSGRAPLPINQPSNWRPKPQYRGYWRSPSASRPNCRRDRSRRCASSSRAARRAASGGSPSPKVLSTNSAWEVACSFAASARASGSTCTA